MSPAQSQPSPLVMRDTSFPFSRLLLRRSKRPRKRKRRRDKTREEPRRARQQEVVQNYEAVKRHVLDVARCRWPTPSTTPPRPISNLGKRTRKKRSRQEMRRGHERSSKKGATLITHVRARCDSCTFFSSPIRALFPVFAPYPTGPSS